eukprot:9099004-Alexandrium_andersonii.AAC.1
MGTPRGRWGLGGRRRRRPSQEDHSLPQSLKEVQSVSDRALQTGQNDALALADRSVDLGPAEVPNYATLDCPV